MFETYNELNSTSCSLYYDIIHIFRGSSNKTNYEKRVILSAYAMLNALDHNYDDSVSYQKIIKLLSETDKEISSIFSGEINANEWNKLQSFIKKYSSDDYRNIIFAAIDEGSYPADESTPDSICKLVLKCLDIKTGETVADLGCCNGNFIFTGACMYPDANFTGYELNLDHYVISKIRATFFKNVKIVLQDIFTLPETKIHFDKVFSNFPLDIYKISINHDFKDDIYAKFPEISKSTSSNWYFNYLLHKVTKSTGKAVGIMSSGSIWNKLDTSVRKSFIENGYIESVTVLPSNLFKISSISTSLIVLSNNNQTIQLVDASQCFEAGRRQNSLRDNDINIIFNALNNPSDISTSVDIATLRENEYVLNYKRYSNTLPRFKNGQPFSSVISNITRGASCSASQLDKMISADPTNTQYLMLSNIENGVINNKLPYLKELDDKYQKYCIHNHDLILSKNGYPYKVAVAEISDDKQVLGNGNLFIITLDPEKANPYYIKAVFESASGIAVLNNISVGSTIPNIGVTDLKKIMIPLPSIEEQNAFVEKYLAKMDEIAVLSLKLDKAKDELKHLFDEEAE